MGYNIPKISAPLFFNAPQICYYAQPEIKVFAFKQKKSILLSGLFLDAEKKFLWTN